MTKNYGWVIVAAGALITCVAMGAMFALPVYLQPIAEDTGWSRAGISMAMTIGFVVMGVAGFFWGTLSDRIGARPVVFMATALLGAGLILASRTTSLTVFQFAYGGLVGASGGAFFAPIISATLGWFDKNRSLAVSLVSIGGGVAPMVMTPLASVLTTAYGWRSAMLMIAVGAMPIETARKFAMVKKNGESALMAAMMTRITASSVSSRVEASRRRRFPAVGVTALRVARPVVSPVMRRAPARCRRARRRA